MMNFMHTEDQQQVAKAMEDLIPSLGKNFYEASLAGTPVFDLLEKAQNSRINIKLQGPTGSGKTTYFEAYCESTEQPHFVSNMKGSTTSEELVGAFVPNESEEGNQYVWKDGVIVRTLKYSNLTIPVEVTVGEDQDGNEMYDWKRPKPNYEIDIEDGLCDDDIVEDKGNGVFVVNAWPKCMLTIEEINFSPEELMSVWFSLLDHRRNIVLNEKDGEVIRAGKFMSVNATMNPDYVGTNQLNAALNDRFLIKLNVDYDNKVENKLINEKAKKFQLHVKEIQILKKFVSEVRKGFREGACDSNISTRMIEAYLEIKGRFGDMVAEASLLNAFPEADLDYANQQLEKAKAESDTIDISAEEMEGLDLKSFKGWAPKKKTASKSRKPKAKSECPF
jgi:MoxR-like ATPase